MAGMFRMIRFKGKAAFALPFFLACVVLGATAAAGDESLKPFTPWHVDWTETSCVMRRGFGDETKFVVVQIERFAPSDDFQLVVTGDRLGHLHQGDRLLISYGDGSQEKASYFQMGKTSTGTPSLLISSSSFAPLDEDLDPPMPVTPKMEAAAKSVNLVWPGKRLVLLTGPMDKAFAALRTCTDDLVKTWGFDPEIQKSLSRRARPATDPSHWLLPDDYPPGAKWSGKQAIVNFRLSINVDGKPTACDIQKSYSGEEFDDRSCELLMRRARFQPALDAAGKPVASYYVDTVKWYMP